MGWGGETFLVLNLACCAGRSYPHTARGSVSVLDVSTRKDQVLQSKSLILFCWVPPLIIPCIPQNTRVKRNAHKDVPKKAGVVPVVNVRLPRPSLSTVFSSF